MTTKESNNCSRRVYAGSFSGHACRKAATFEYEGKMYCSVHYPPNIEAKQAGWKESRDKQADIERKAELYDELLEALKDLERQFVNVMRAASPSANYESTENRFADNDSTVLLVRKIIAKAEGRK